MTTLKKFHWFWAWQDEKEEAWLSEMAHQGWHLQTLDYPGIYTFAAGEPREVAYRLDFFTDRKNRDVYLQLFQDAGWEFVGEMGTWQYFRKPAQVGERPEIYTDNQSKVKKYQRVVGILVVFLPIYIVMLNNLNRGGRLIYRIAFFLSLFIILVFLYALIMLTRRIIQLKR